ncbi:MAG: class I tRNA ligase family protein, partial [Thermoplasmata archaeon]|nr:class I tRNA ligase family protein [Thermoplasmata archaeon]
SRMSEELDGAFGAFELTRAATLLYQFLWHDLADRYVELAKDGLNGARGEPIARESRATIAFVLDRLLRQLHPFVPHVTEELWHALPHEGESLAVAHWPNATEATQDPGAEVAVDVVLEAIRALRNLRAESHVPATERPAGGVVPAGPEEARLLESERATIVRLARVERLDIVAPGAAPPPTPARAVSPRGEFFLLLRDAGAAGEALERERAKLQALLDKTRGRLADPGFRDRAPPSVVEEARAKAVELEERIRKIAANLAPVPVPTSETPS